MANRTVKVYGNVVSGPVNLTVSINNIEVFSEVVAAIAAEMQVLATFELDEAIGSPLAATFVVSGGDITVQRLEANHLTSLGPVLDKDGNATDVIITETSTKYTEFRDYSGGGWADKSDIVINGVAQGDITSSVYGPSEFDLNEESTGSWHIKVRDGETMTCNFIV